MNVPGELTKGQKVYSVFKRGMDIFFSALLIILCALPMLIVLIITKLTSKGPALFCQTRLGKNKETFTLIKFRSMRIDAPEIPPELITPELTKKYITKWGMFMRRTSLDELPQLFLIFIGKMSFIGPRPSQVEEKEKSLCVARDSFEPSCYLVLPGLSGLAQVKLHRDYNPYHKAELDSQYVKNLSFWEDLKIFFLSFTVIINSGGRTHK